MYNVTFGLLEEHWEPPASQVRGAGNPRSQQGKGKDLTSLLVMFKPAYHGLQIRFRNYC